MNKYAQVKIRCTQDMKTINKVSTHHKIQYAQYNKEQKCRRETENYSG